MLSFFTKKFVLTKTNYAGFHWHSDSKNYVYFSIPREINLNFFGLANKIEQKIENQVQKTYLFKRIMINDISGISTKVSIKLLFCFWLKSHPLDFFPCFFTSKRIQCFYIWFICIFLLLILFFRKKRWTHLNFERKRRNFIGLGCFFIAWLICCMLVC